MKTKFGIGYDGHWVSCLDRRWPYSTQEEHQQALELANEYGLSRQFEIQERLGRQLTDREARQMMVDHPEDQDTAVRCDTERMYAEVFAEPVEPEDPNPYRRALREQERARAEKEDPDYHLKQLAEEFDRAEAKKVQDAERQAVIAGNPAAQQAIADGKAKLLALKFDPRAGASEIRAAEFRLRLAENGHVDHYAAETKQFQMRYAETLTKQAQPSVEAAQRKLKQCEALSAPFNLAPPPPNSWDDLWEQQQQQENQ